MTANGFDTSRRQFLKKSGLALGALGLAQSPVAPASPAGSHFDLALQGYSLKSLDLSSLLEVAASIGIDHLELYDDQLSVFASADERSRIRQAFNEAGITLAATYTDEFSEDAESNRRILDFGEAMGLRLISCKPSHAVLVRLDEQVAERAIGIALHNTSPGPGESFVRIEELEVAMERLAHIDACVDVGNFARAGVDPIEALRRLRGRVLEVHIKDIGPDGTDVALGQGTLDLRGVINELKESRFDGLVTLERTGGSRELEKRTRDIARNFSRLRRWSK